MIFVFGSNLQGVHGKGAARFALDNHGAVWGVGEGHRGNSYALPTRRILPNRRIETLPLDQIWEHVKRFLVYAYDHPDHFQITRIGCGLAGYKDEQIAPLFKNTPSNCYFDLAWHPYLGPDRNYWGTT